MGARQLAFIHLKYFVLRVLSFSKKYEETLCVPVLSSVLSMGA